MDRARTLRPLTSPGFTLLELMTVVALVGIMTAIATVQVSSAVQRANAPVHGVRVHGLLSDARNLARRTNRCVRVTRNADGSVLSAQTFATCALAEVCRCRASALPDETLTLTLDNVIPRNARVQPFAGTGVTAGFTDVAVADALVFLADGSTPHPTSVGVTVSVPVDGVAQTATLRVMPATGIVRLVQAGEAP